MFYITIVLEKKLGPSWRAENGNPQYVAYIFVHVISGWNPAQLNYVDKYRCRYIAEFDDHIDKYNI